MSSSTTTRARLAPVLGALAIATLLAACSTRAATPPPVLPAADSPPPMTPAPLPLPDASEEPGSDAMPIRVDLDSTSGQDVYVDIVDRSGTIERAESGRPGEGVSVAADTVHIENVDARTLRLVWSDFPIDNGLSLYVDPVGGGYRFLLIQPAPTGPADAMGEDRILELTFDRDVSAADVEASIQEGLDTPG